MGVVEVQEGEEAGEAFAFQVPLDSSGYIH